MYRKWSQSEIQFLRENNSFSNNELSLILNRTVESIKSKAKKLNLKKNRVPSIGSVFNRLRLIDTPFFRNNRLYGIFICKCGEMTEKRLDNVIGGYTKSCGDCKYRTDGITFYIESNHENRSQKID